MDDQMFRTVMRGFDKEEVFAYIRQVEADANQKIAQARADVAEKDRQIADLKMRIQNKDAKYERLENEIEVKYRTYIDNYEKIGSLVYESQMKGDQIIAEAQKEAARLTSESRQQYDKTMAEAERAAQIRLDAVQGEIDAKLGDAKRQYAVVQEDMNALVELVNEAQKRFMQAYKAVHEVVQRMPDSFDDIDTEDTVAAAQKQYAQNARKEDVYVRQSVTGPAREAELDDDLDDFDSYDSDFDEGGMRFSFSEFDIEDDDFEEEMQPPRTPVMQGQLANAPSSDTVDFSRLGISGAKLDYRENDVPIELETMDTGDMSGILNAGGFADSDGPDYDFGNAFADEGVQKNPFADEGTFRLPGEKI